MFYEIINFIFSVIYFFQVYYLYKIQISYKENFFKSIIYIIFFGNSLFFPPMFISFFILFCHEISNEEDNSKMKMENSKMNNTISIEKSLTYEEQQTKLNNLV